MRPQESAGQDTGCSGHWFSLILGGGDKGKGPKTTHPAARKQSRLCVSDSCRGRREETEKSICAHSTPCLP